MDWMHPATKKTSVEQQSFASVACSVDGLPHQPCVTTVTTVYRCNTFKWKNNKWSKYFGKRPHHRRTWTVHLHSPCGVNVHLHLTHASLDPPESTSQTASGSVQPFLQASRWWQIDRQTDRQTDHVTSSAPIGCICVPSNAMPSKTPSLLGLQKAHIIRVAPVMLLWIWRKYRPKSDATYLLT